MFRFEDPIYLYGLVLVALLAVVRFISNRSQKKRLRKFGDPELLKQLMPDVSRARKAVKFYLLEAALALLFVMLARPQFGTRISHEKRTGIETVIAMDISNSMRAQDVQPSRLDRAKMMIENLVDNFTNDKIGLIVFAGDAFVQLPITSDYVSAKMFLSSIDPSMIQNQGTDIAAAIRMASHSFTQQENIGKAIIVITDGEDHEGGALDAAKEAKEMGMRVYVLGFGSTSGAPIPVKETGEYMTDNSGNTVMSALNEQMCSEIAQAGGGAYIHVENNSNAQRMLDAELDKLEKSETESTMYSDFDEQFQAVGIIVLLLLILEVIILESKNPLMSRIKIFGKKDNSKKSSVFMSVLIMCVLTMGLFVSLPVSAQNDRSHVRHGNKFYQKKDFEHAETSYSKAIEKNDKNPQAHYNLGNALLAQRKDSAAVVAYEKSCKLETNPTRKSMAYHNLGVVCQQHKMYGEAIENYKQCLRLNPRDDEARYNLELCKRQKQNQDKDKQNHQQQQKQQQQQNQQQDQQQDKQQEKKQEQQKPQMSKENAEQLLNAAMQQEKQTQKRMNEAQKQGDRRRNEKNW
ncbi:MAG: VWA domain-containing protein [Prevotella sp.]|nr:VWA domain-containing protein [Prevotella sp.]